MYPTSNTYKEEIAKNSITSTWRGVITLPDGHTQIDIDEKNIIQNSSKIRRQLVNGETLEIGNAVAAELKLGLRDTDSLTISDHRYDLYDSRIEVFFRLYIGNSYEEVPVGRYTVTDCEYTYNSVTLTAFDNMNKATKTIGSKLSDMTAYAALSALTAIMGVGLATTEEEITSMPNGGVTWKTSTYSKNTACKDIIGDICACLGANAIVDSNGAVVIKPFNNTSVRTLGAGARYSSTYVAYLARYNKIALENKDGDEEVYTASSTGTGKLLTLSIGANDLINAKNATDRNTIATAIINSIQPIAYGPCKLTVPQDPSIDIADTLTVSGGRLDNSIQFVLTDMTIPFFGQMALVSAGGNYELSTNKKATKAEKAVHDNTYNINEVQNNLNITNNNVTYIQGEVQTTVERVTTVEGDVTQLSGNVTALAAQVNLDIILPYGINLDEVTDLDQGGTLQNVLMFSFDCASADEVVIFHAELCFNVHTFTKTVNGVTTYQDGKVTIAYELDGTVTNVATHYYGDGWKTLTLDGIVAAPSVGTHYLNVQMSAQGASLY